MQFIQSPLMNFEFFSFQSQTICEQSMLLRQRSLNRRWKPWQQTSHQMKLRYTETNFNSLTPKILLSILPSSCYTFPCKLIVRIWCLVKITALYLMFEYSHKGLTENREYYSSLSLPRSLLVCHSLLIIMLALKTYLCFLIVVLVFFWEGGQGGKEITWVSVKGWINISIWATAHLPLP